ncbi:MAG: SDR family oxidoreductase, partial [Sphingomonadaceae bacterium]
MPQTWMITGANRGIGFALTKVLAARGDHVIAAARDAGSAALAELTRAHAGRVTPIALDVTSDASVAAARAALGARPIDVLVNNAGILRDRMVFNLSEGEWDAVIAVHLKGTFNCLRHACAHMRQQRYGRIVTFSSGAGLFGNPGQANYGAAKSAIGGLTKVAARDLGKYGVTVNAICPVAGTRMTVNEEVRRARELRRQQGIQREDRGVA